MELNLHWLEAVLRNHSREKAVKKVLSFEQEPAVPKGENFSSDMIRLTCKAVLGSGNIVRKSVILKKHPDLQPHQLYLAEYHAYPIEIIMYSEILPEMERLMLEYGDTSDKLWCDIYSFKTNDYMILEDLKESGFRNVGRTELMDLDHILFTMRNIARFHAMSVVLLHKNRLDKKSLAPYCMARNVPKMNQLMYSGMKMLVNVMKADWGSEWEEAANRISELSKGIGAKMEKLCQESSNNLLVLNHGDCWINNIMFRHELGTEIPIGVRFIDLQESHFNSYGWDLTFIMRTGMKRSEWALSQDKILGTYLDSLKAALEFYGVQPDRVPGLKEARAEMDRLSLYGFVLSSVAIPFFMADSEDALEIDDLINEDDPHAMQKKMRMYKSQEYTRLIQNDVRLLMRSLDSV